ncbi:unnamed protein product [Meganyctiphanes norvegica]|uniref:Uncharacterized protein n=1 Tax=Meganyctiphanes norvegica TaxID=48144 RepID=A0AAV2R2X5_MEGNR
MLRVCSYQILDSLVPPSVEENKCIQDSLLRLESICACSIVRSKNCQILSETPTHLYKIMLKAYLRDEYYTQIRHDFGACKPRISYIYNDLWFRRWPGPKDECMLGGLSEILYHWPHEEFDLKEVMPKVPSRIRDFSLETGNSKFPSILYDKKVETINDFYEMVVNVIFRKMLMKSKDTLSHSTMHVVQKTHVNTCKIRQINVSGMNTFQWYNHLKDYIGHMGISEPILNNGKLEIILDIDTHRCHANVNRFAYSQLNSQNSVVLRFNHMSLELTDHSPVGVTQMAQLIKMLVKDFGTVSLHLFGGSITDISAVMETAFENNEKQSNIISVQVHGQVDGRIRMISSIHFVQYFNNLVHLELIGINLHGKLDILKHMHRGLWFLSITRCHLNNADLAQLVDSCHQETLKELNLSNNRFTYDNNYDNLIRMCQKLAQVQILKLYCCHLESWPINEIKLFFYSLKKMPNIVILDLTENEFLEVTVKEHIMVLKENHSLRVLKLFLPSQFMSFDEDSDVVKSFCSTINGNINNGRSQVLFVELKY